LRFLVDGIQRGVVPKDVVYEAESDSRRAFLQGQADFMRNWPNVFEDARRSPIADDVSVRPLPSWKGRSRVGVLGGHDLVISAFSKNTTGALVICRSPDEPGEHPRGMHSLRGRTGAGQAVGRSYGAAGATGVRGLRDAVFHARSRPVTPNYLAVSRAIYANVHRALQGELSPQQAVAVANGQIQQALDVVRRRPPGRR
jgi:multiple sugar transport system substrate-binding protein